MGAGGAVGVVAHLGGAAPDREGGDEGRPAEPGRGEQARCPERVSFGRDGGAQEGDQAPRLGPPDREDDDRLLVLDWALALE